ncbi:rapid alkalinization factor-domain-containing protein [Elsinoe ampelina]|uniref:Rapid alkalinization factor-domain-containing protein n=1 Tax=Elsinoe ampelina TaxID=302913 RepID=A0A6A6G9R9_9PEZI|nr:rapid alkalinization factor-domain-containing protein [Elsinoe ampelina]
MKISTFLTALAASIGVSTAAALPADTALEVREEAVSGHFICYGALQRNTIPCSRVGNSFTNCKLGTPANPYTRGCSTITMCRQAFNCPEGTKLDWVEHGKVTHEP